ncbi:MAG: nucleotide exchange factor GrpE [Crocinitomicaceae bacterium]|nr:nucleotide exchange factor GrpE [Crocinitomicaceae bacterium]
MTKKKNRSEEELEDQVTNQHEEDNTDQKTTEKTIEEKYEELNSKYLLLYSDFDNFRKRSMKEKLEIINTASGEVIKDLLDVLDDFERAVANNDKVEDPAALREGFKLIHHKLMNVLSHKGLESMNAKGEVFDADKHEAITQIPAPSEDMKGKVVDVIERGYNLKGSVLRYAKVVVGQ